jgi:hypothetical protein
VLGEDIHELPHCGDRTDAHARCMGALSGAWLLTVPMHLKLCVSFVVLQCLVARLWQLVGTSSELRAILLLFA